MTRDAFMARLWDGLKGLPPQTAAEIVADYQTHFKEGEAAGRTDDDISAALGDPERLAVELRAEAGLKRWESERNPAAAGAAVFAVLGLGAIDLLILLPILMGVVCTLFGMAIACIGVMIGGAVVFAAGPFSQPPGGPATALLGGLGLMAGAVSGAAILTLISIGLTNALVWYGRLHFRLLKPAIDTQPWATTEPARP